MIVVIGSINMDLVLRVPRMPAPGETLAGASFTTIPGGKGANQAVACARLGTAPVAMVGCIGDDGFGASMRAALRADGIDDSHVSTTAGTSTGVASILVDDAGQNSIVIVGGANALLTPAHIDAARGLIERASIVVLQLEVPMETVAHAIKLAHGLGKTVVLNPAPAQSLPPSLLALVDYLVPNEIEAAMLVGDTQGAGGAPETRGANPGYDPSGLGVPVKTPALALGSSMQSATAAQALLAQGSRTVLITLGPDGVYAADASGAHLYPAQPVRAIDTTAAGDTFIGGLVAALASGAALPDAISRGQRAAAIGVTRVGAQTSIPHLSELESA
ncbi:ribokinase [Oxalobacteraceae bacterium]|nr:ribokinase [Oxalobacteraceae bacterium]